MSFYVGQKVVCVDASSMGQGGSWRKGEALVEGAIYKIRRCFLRKGKLDVHLFEVERTDDSKAEWGNDVGYAAERFRPLAPREADISIFTKMLNQNKELT